MAKHAHSFYFIASKRNKIIIYVVNHRSSRVKRIQVVKESHQFQLIISNIGTTRAYQKLNFKNLFLPICLLFSCFYHKIIIIPL